MSKELKINKIDIVNSFIGEYVCFCLSSISSLTTEQNHNFFKDFGEIISENMEVGGDEENSYFLDNKNENNKIYVLSSLRGTEINIFESIDEKDIKRIFIISSAISINIKKLIEYVSTKFLAKLVRIKRIRKEGENLEFAGKLYKKENDKLIVYDPFKVRSEILENNINIDNLILKSKKNPFLISEATSFLEPGKGYTPQFPL